MSPRTASPLLVFLLVCATPALAQTTHSVRHHTVAVEQNSSAAALLDQAETLLAKGDYAGAEPLLQQATARDPKSYQAWYDLGYAHQAMDRTAEAIGDYRKSLGLNPQIFETNLNLGLALTSSGERDQALKYLKAATQLHPAHPGPSMEHAWLSLGKLAEAGDQVEAEHALVEAAKLAPADPEPHLALGELYENQGKLDQAKTQYQQALAQARGNAQADALRGLVNVAVESKQLTEAETSVRQYLSAVPSDGRAHLLRGRLLAAQGKNEDALAELNASGESANDPGGLQEKAQLLAAVNRNQEAAAIYQRLVEQDTGNAPLRYQYALVLMQQHQFPAAQQQLLAALKLNPNLAAAYGDLAVVASENQQYELTLKALEARSKLVGDNPGTYFLRATALDHLRRFPEAAQNYRQFLAFAKGKFPDQEWQARHRLVAIQKMK